MEKLVGITEFLCLRCGLQGLCEAKVSDSVSESSVLCPKCGNLVITTHLLEMRKEEPSLAMV
jgi:predicted RNA-binding Zn-ribbon protein involved in translation (DUF1610 family)